MGRLSNLRGQGAAVPQRDGTDRNGRAGGNDCKRPQRHGTDWRNGLLRAGHHLLGAHPVGRAQGRTGQGGADHRQPHRQRAAAGQRRGQAVHLPDRLAAGGKLGSRRVLPLGRHPAAGRAFPAGTAAVRQAQGSNDHPLAGADLSGSFCRLCPCHFGRLQRLCRLGHHLPVHHRHDPFAGQRTEQKKAWQRRWAVPEGSPSPASCRSSWTS